MNEKLAKKVFGDWYGVLSPILSSDYFKYLISNLQIIYKAKKPIWPEQKNVFKAFRLTKYEDLKVVIIGIDPFPNNRATGLAFANSLKSGGLSPSLCQIRNSIENNYYKGLNLNFDQTLESWAKQGVLLLNTSLTIEEGRNGSHKNQWNSFTEYLLNRLSIYNTDVVYVLFGKKAQEYEKFIDKVDNYIIKAEHPSIFTYGNNKWDFSFKKIDEITKKINNERIKW